MVTNFKCPHCNKEVELTEALRHEIEEQVRLDLAKKHTQELQQAKEQGSKELQTELLFLKEEKEKTDKQLEEARKMELSLRKEKNEIEEEKRSFEIDKQRQIDKERGNIRQKTLEEAYQTFHLKEKEKDLMIEALKKSLEEAQRKAQQGSQQTQGEALETTLEGFIKQTFPNDQMKEVKKGAKGGDVIQEVWNSRGEYCGKILWEAKNTPNWTNAWIAKLKNDQRSINADTSILVSETLPKEIKEKGVGFQEGVWVTNRVCAMSLAMGLRAAIIQLHGARKSAEGKNEKMEILWNYFNGVEFLHRMEAILTAFNAQQTEMEKERNFFNQKWARQEKSLRLVFDNTHGLYGDLEGITQTELPKIKTLELTPSGKEYEDK